jgi:hypothetical protein
VAVVQSVAAVGLLVIPAVIVIGVSTRSRPHHQTPAGLDCAPPDVSMSAGSTLHCALRRVRHPA